MLNQLLTPDEAAPFDLLQQACEFLKHEGYDNIEIASALTTLLAATMVESREEFDSGEGYRKASVILEHIWKESLKDPDSGLSGHA